MNKCSKCVNERSGMPKGKFSAVAWNSHASKV